jgi:hypothetical protein
LSEAEFRIAAERGVDESEYQRRRELAPPPMLVMARTPFRLDERTGNVCRRVFAVDPTSAAALPAQ